MTSEQLWQEVRSCFDADDGSLPSIQLNNLTAGGVASIFVMVLGRFTVKGPSPTFWNRATGNEQNLDSVDNAAALVVSGEAETFHLLLEYRAANDVTLANLGFTVWPDGVEFDYRMGCEWDPAKVSMFFGLLYDCIKLDGSALLSLPIDGPPNPECFMVAWRKYRESRNTNA